MKKIKLLIGVLFLAITSSVFAQGIRFAPTQLIIKFDNNPQEVTWEVRSTANTVVQTGGGFGSDFANRTIAFDIVDVFGQGNYLFVIKDSGGNGLSGDAGWVINTRRFGRAEGRRLNDLVGTRVFNGNSNFGAQSITRIDPLARASSSGSIGNIGPRSISLFQGSDGFFQIGSNDRLVPFTGVPNGGDGNNDGPEAIGDVINFVRVVNRNPGRLRVVLDNTGGNDNVRIVVRDRNGNVIRNVNRSLANGRNRINIFNLRRGRHFLTITTAETTGSIERRTFVR